MPYPKKYTPAEKKTFKDVMGRPAPSTLPPMKKPSKPASKGRK